MYKSGDIIINKKNPTFILRVLNREMNSAIVVDSKNSSNIGKKVNFIKDGRIFLPSFFFLTY